MEFDTKQHAKIGKFEYFILGADIGGTNSNLAVAGVKKGKYKLILSFNYKTKSLPSLESALNHCLEVSKKDYGLKISKACLGVAGPVEKGTYCKPTFIGWDVSMAKILKNTPLKKVTLVNDFVALGYSINILKKRDLKKLNAAKPEAYAVKAVLGAGTGLGETVLYYDEDKNCYIPLPSEGGHNDVPVKSLDELKLFNGIQERIKKPLGLAHVLSGQGIECIYDVVKNKYEHSEVRKIIEESDAKASLISKFKKQDGACKETFEIFTKLYGRTAKNFSLSTLCFGGLYIGGGIATKNKDIFESEIFWQEFYDSSMKENVLEKIPIFLVENYDSGIRGALFAALKS